MQNDNVKIKNGRFVIAIRQLTEKQSYKNAFVYS